MTTNAELLADAQQDYPGWWSLIEQLDAQLNYLMPEGYSILQIKEKFGALRFYWMGPVDDAGDSKLSEMQHMIAEICVRDAERTSEITCDACGKWAELRDDLGWICTLCTNHYQEKLDSITLPELLCETCGEPATIKTVWHEPICLDCYKDK